MCISKILCRYDKGNLVMICQKYKTENIFNCHKIKRKTIIVQMQSVQVTLIIKTYPYSAEQIQQNLQWNIIC